MKKLLLSVSILALTILNSCTQDAVNNEATVLESSQSSSLIDADYKGRIRRIRLKETRSGNFKTTVVLNKTDPNDKLQYIHIKMEHVLISSFSYNPDNNEDSTGFDRILRIDGEDTYISSGDYFESNGEIIIDDKIFRIDEDFVYTYTAIGDENESLNGLVGSTLLATVSFYDKDGIEVGEPEITYVNIEDYDGIRIIEPTLKLKNNGNAFKLNTRVIFNEPFEGPDPQDLEVKVQLLALYGGSELKNQDCTLDFLRINSFTYTQDEKTILNKKPSQKDWILIYDEADVIFGKRVIEETNSLEIDKATVIYRNNKVEFIETDNVVDMEYIATVQLYSGDEELDYAEFIITGQE